MKELYVNIDNIILKRYDDYYYVSKNGDVYSLYSKKFIKHYIDADGYHRVDIHRKHKKVHRLVYEVWKSQSIENVQINHKDDNKDNNNIENLYAGTQRENIADCIKNKHRKGHIIPIIIYDKLICRTIQSNSCKDFIKYSGHSQKNGSLSRCMKTKWFNERFIYLGRCND